MSRVLVVALLWIGAAVALAAAADRPESATVPIPQAQGQPPGVQTHGEVPQAQFPQDPVHAEAQSRPQSLSRGLGAADLAVIINTSDPLSVAIGDYYVRRRHIPNANVVRVHFDYQRDEVPIAEFTSLKSAIESKVPSRVQAYALTWARPYRVGCMFDTNRFLPGAIADHLTSYGGMLTDSPQMSSLRWLEAGATGSYGTVVEPCNFPSKFPDISVLVSFYLAGETLIEAYWKSVVMPGQGLFIGEPLAAPFRGPVR